MLHVVVVESHQHALEHLHHVLRKRKLLVPWSMIHFDAHPDLACPGPFIPAQSCFQPRNSVAAVSCSNRKTLGEVEEKDLYEFLDSTSSGIAEWILPLVLAANLRNVRWVRPKQLCLSQLPSGEHRFHVGAWSPSLRQSTVCEAYWDLPQDAVVKVDWPCSYYEDDNSVVPSSKLLLPKPLNLTVDEEVGIDDQDDDWVLDICLDYFSCLNPFWKDMECTNEVYATTFRQAVEACPLYASYASSDPARLRDFRLAISDLFTALINDLLNADPVPITTFNGLIEFYESSDETLKLWQPVVYWLPNEEEKRRALLQASQEIIPNLAMPHQPHPSNTEALQPLLDSVERQLAQHDQRKKPMLVTIARSVDDGFTPRQHVENLQSETLNMVHNLYCGCSNKQGHDCKIKITRDYGEWEGSTLDI